METPEVTLAAAADAVALPHGNIEELTGPLQGWKRKVSEKKGGTPKKEDITFVAPDGEEIKNKRQLNKYLKAHPGTVTASDFEWTIPAGNPVTPNEMRRRSARLNSKGRTSTEGVEEEIEPKEPVLKRSRKSRDKAAGKDVADKAGDETLGKKQKENGEDAGDNKPMDVDSAKVDAPALEETKEVTAETLTTKSEDEKKVDGEKLLGEAPEESKVGVDSEAREDAENANGIELPKSKEERHGNGTWKATFSRSGLDVNNVSLCSTSSLSWDPTDGAHVLAVKKALHLSIIPSSVLCRDNEQKKVIRFCKSAILDQVPGSMYVCGCPGTGKSLTMEQVKLLSVSWAEEAKLPPPDIVSVNCTTLTDPRKIYQKVLQLLKNNKVDDVSSKSWSLCLKELRQRVCETPQRPASPKRMLFLIVDEMDYLITRNQEVLYDLFQLPMYPNSCCILMGIANAIDLTDRFLPKMRSMNCKPDVVTFPAYTKDQILTVLTQRLKSVPFTAFHMAALELCARKVAAASGDMRKALHVCRSALEILETEVKAEVCKYDIERVPSNGSAVSGVCESSSFSKPLDLVCIDHMAKALACTFRSPVVETIQNLPQHQQMVLCSAVRLFRRAKKDATLGELNKAYLDFCKGNSMHALAGSEFSSMCRVLADQALLKLGESREDRLRRVTLQVNQDDIVFALQGVRFFRNSLS